MQQSIVLKIKYNDDIRRVRFIEKGFVGLQKQIGDIYGIQQGTFTLKYRDDEGDLVTISSEEEFSESFKFIQNNILRLEITSLEEKKEGEGRCGRRKWKGKCNRNKGKHHHGHHHQHGTDPYQFINQLNHIANQFQEGSNLNNFINSGNCHIEHNYICDGCETNIRGTRYHCSECPDFDFCSTCYETKLNTHPEHKFVTITALEALKEALANGEQIDSFFEVVQEDPVPEQQEDEKIQQQQNLEKEIIEQERIRQQLEQEMLEKERLEQERIEKEKLEQERIEKERLEQERIEQERLEKERLENERLEKERLEQERIEKEKLVEQPKPQNKNGPLNYLKDILFPIRNPEPQNNVSFEKKLEDLTSMGFDKQKSIQALVQKKGNIQLAIELLLKN